MVDIINRIIKRGKVYVDESFNKETVGPLTVFIEGRKYYRFMDFFYITSPPHFLTTEDVVEVCNLRLDYFEKVVNLEFNRNVVLVMTNYLKENAININNYTSALDFGCGSGVSTTLLKQNIGISSLIGVDISEKAVQLAKNLKLEVELLTIDKHFPFKNDSFDFIFAIFVMHFNISFFSFNEIYRVLKPGGLFLYNYYNVESFNNQKFLHETGFIQQRIISNGELPRNHYVALCEKPKVDLF